MFPHDYIVMQEHCNKYRDMVDRYIILVRVSSYNGNDEVWVMGDIHIWWIVVVLIRKYDGIGSADELCITL